MARRKRSGFPLNTAQSLVALVVVAGIVAVIVASFAPDKPTAPPKSTAAYAERPEEKLEKTASQEPPPDPGPLYELPADLASEDFTTQPEEVEVLSGRYMVYGTVTEKDSGEAVPGVYVVLSSGEAGSEEQYYTITGADGGYRFDLDEPGRWRVVVPTREQMASQQMSPLDPYEADAGETTDDQPKLQHDIRLDYGATIAGRVSETGTGLPALDVDVALYDETGQAEIGTVVTDEDGRFQLLAPTIGVYGVRVKIEDSAYRMGREVPYRRVRIARHDEQVTGIDFQVDPAGVVWGYVTTPDGEPVPNTEVVLATTESPLSQLVTAALRQAPPVSDRSQEDGYYELLGVPFDEEWQVYATSRQHSPQLANPFIVTPTAPSLRVDVFMFPGSDVSGVVVDESGAAVPDARVRSLPTLSNLVRPLDQAQAFRDARADADGYFTIRQLPAGTYRIYAQKQGYKFDATGVPIYPDGYSAMTNVRVVLQEVGAGTHDIYGVVMNSAREVIAGADVALEGVSTETMERVEMSASTSSDGTFRFAEVTGGRYGVTVTHPDYAPARIPRIALDEENTIFLQRMALVAGRVEIRETGAPPDGPFTIDAQLTGSAESGGVSYVSSESFSQTFEDPTGYFELYLPPGEYQLTARAEGLAPGRVSVLAAMGEDAAEPVTIYFRQDGARISGRVTTFDGEAPQGATVTLVDTSGGLAAATSGSAVNTEFVVGGDGEFFFEQLPEGRYVLYADHPVYTRASSDPIVLAVGESREGVQIRLGQGGVLTGYACKADGSPWPNTDVLVTAVESSTFEQTTSGSDGYFEVDELPTGTYTVSLAEVSSINALTSDIRARTVYVEDGQTSTIDFCTQGITVIGVCDPPPLAGTTGLVFVTAPGTPATDVENLDPFRLASGLYGGENVGIGTGEWAYPNVGLGDFQLEIVYVDIIGGNARSVFKGDFTATGDQDTVNIGYIRVD